MISHWSGIDPCSSCSCWIYRTCLFDAGEQWWRGRGSSRGHRHGASCHLLRPSTSPPSPSERVHASGLTVGHCQLAVRAHRCLPASACLPTLQQTLRLLAHGRLCSKNPWIFQSLKLYVSHSRISLTSPLLLFIITFYLFCRHQRFSFNIKWYKMSLLFSTNLAPTIF